MGGKTKGKGRAYKGNKHVGRRGHPARAETSASSAFPDVTRKTLHAFIGRAIRDEAEAIYTDDLKSYLGICDDDTRHETVNHSAEEWAVGDVHALTRIEGVWSLFKRSIVGARSTR